MGELIVRLFACAAMLSLSGTLKSGRDLQQPFVEAAREVFQTYVNQLGTSGPAH